MKIYIKSKEELNEDIHPRWDSSGINHIYDTWQEVIESFDNWYKIKDVQLLSEYLYIHKDECYTEDEYRLKQKKMYLDRLCDE